MVVVNTSRARARKISAPRTSTSKASTLAFCSWASSVNSSKRVRKMDSSEAASPPTASRKAMGMASAAADECADQHTDQTGHANGAPGIVVHVVVGSAHGSLAAKHQFVLCGVEMLAGAAQGPHCAVAQFLSLFARGFSGLLQHAFRFIQTFLHLLDEFLFPFAEIFLVHVTTPVVWSTSISKPGTDRQAAYLPTSRGTMCVSAWSRKFCRPHRPSRG